MLTLPCLLLVILTWYRYGDLKRASEKRWGVLSHHVLLLWNAMVVLHAGVSAVHQNPPPLENWPQVQV